MTEAPLLQIENLRKHYAGRRGGPAMRAVDDVSLTVRHGETVALIGESGCGKSTTARCVLRLVEPDGGRVLFDGVDVTRMDRTHLRAMRRHFQFVFQNPFASLNGRMKIGAILEEPLIVHGMGTAAWRAERVNELLVRVGLGPDHAQRLPYELSGGQRQRVGIARALALQPRLVICDEPVSALDVSVKAQIINLLSDLRREFGLSYLFITHDLDVVRRIADRVAIMLAGRIVELTDVHTLFRAPAHPYTRLLLGTMPHLDPHARAVPGAMPADSGGAALPAAGCPFAPRCPFAIARCQDGPVPLPLLASDATHAVACIRANELPPPDLPRMASLSPVAVRRLAALERMGRSSVAVPTE